MSTCPQQKYFSSHDSWNVRFLACFGRDMFRSKCARGVRPWSFSMLYRWRHWGRGMYLLPLQRHTRETSLSTWLPMPGLVFWPKICTSPTGTWPTDIWVVSARDVTPTFIIIISIRVFCPMAGPSLQAQEHRLQFCRRQVFHRKLRNQDCSFTMDWIGAVTFRCFPHPTLSSASEQTLKDLKRSLGSQREGEESEFGQLGPLDFTEIHHRGYISVPLGFLTRSENRISQLPFAPQTKQIQQ